MPTPKNAAPLHSGRVMLRDVVRQRIRDAIMDGTFEPGEVLKDSDLQTWLGVSRTPVREALNQLAQIGLVEMEANRYTRVVSPSAEETVDAMRTLGILWGGAARLALPRMDAKKRQAFVETLDRVLDAIRNNEQQKTIEQSRKFFERLVELGGNQFLNRISKEAMDGLGYRMQVAVLAGALDPRDLLADLEAISEALRAGDAIRTELAIEKLHQLPVP